MFLPFISILKSPLCPISNPFFYAVSLFRFWEQNATLGLAEDTWALNEGVLDKSAFMEDEIGGIYTYHL
jgi:hypothetical protein